MHSVKQLLDKIDRSIPLNSNVWLRIKKEGGGVIFSGEEDALPLNHANDKVKHVFVEAFYDVIDFAKTGELPVEVTITV